MAAPKLDTNVIMHPRLRDVSQSPPEGQAPEKTPLDDNRADYVEELYNRYRSSLLNYIMGILPGGQNEASEILHETYIRLLRQESLQKLEDNARAYIFTIATNLVRDTIRKRISRQHDAHVSFQDEDFTSEDAGPASTANWNQSMSMLKEALMELPPLTRKIFLLSRFEEMTYPEIAKALSVSTRTVERHMSKACKTLQTQLGGLL